MGLFAFFVCSLIFTVESSVWARGANLGEQIGTVFVDKKQVSNPSFGIFE